MALPVCTIDDNGIFKPDYNTVKIYFEEKFRAIYGQDVYLEPDSQDGQFLAILASAVDDVNSATVAAYNSFSPASARGTGLSSVVKINGIARNTSSFSTVDVIITGQAGTTITNGVVQSADGAQWLLPASVVIPVDGDITVTATAKTKGAVRALPREIQTIGTPTRGWQSVVNLVAATPGAPVETDAELRIRQTRSVALPARSLLDGIVGAIADIYGVTQVAAYENTGNSEDENGVPGHSISMVVEGGDVDAIAGAIAVNKGPGVRTWGDTTASVVDDYGIPRQISFYRPEIVQIKATIQIVPYDGFTSATQMGIRDAVVAAISALHAGDDVILSRLYGPANSAGTTYNITSILIGRLGDPVLAADIPIAFFENARAVVGNIAIQVLR